jgi:hypothetical protein
MEVSMNETVLFEGLFKRGQVEWALWHAFHERTNHSAPEKIPLIFSNRIKRLLEIDSKSILSPKAQIGFAFLSERQTGNGNDRMFSVFDTFLLGIALDLLDAGLNQGQVVLQLQATRHKLHGQLSMILSEIDGVFPNTQKYKAPSPDAEVPSNLPAFLIFNRVEMTEIMFPKLPARALIHDLDIAGGWKALGRSMAKRLPGRSHPTIIEFSKLAFDIRKGLESAPIIARGRKSKTLPVKSGSKKK